MAGDGQGIYRTDFTLIVCGFGRYGSSLVMQMLEAGGFPLTGEYPAFEDERSSMEQQKAPVGVAIKVIDPHKFTPQPGNYRWLWLDRDYRQQAKSQLKFARAMMGLPGGKELIARFAKSYEKERPICMEVMRRLGGRVREMKFEYIINSPEAAAVDIGIFAGCRNRESMAKVVRPWSPLCLPNLLEIHLLRERCA